MSVNKGKKTRRNLEKYLFRDKNVKIFKRTYLLKRYIYDGLLLFLAFYALSTAKSGTLVIERRYLSFLPFFYLCWFISLVISNKYRVVENDKRRNVRLDPFFTSVLFFAGMVSMHILFRGRMNLSIFVIFGSLILHLFLTVLFLSDVYFTSLKRVRYRADFSFGLFFAEILFVTAYIFLIPELISSDVPESSNQNIYAFFSLLWVFTGLIVHKFRVQTGYNFVRTVFPFLKSAFANFSIVSFILILLNLLGFKNVIFAGLAVFSGLELCTVMAFFFWHRYVKGSDESEYSVDVYDTEEQRLIDGVIQRDKKYKETLSMAEKDFQSIFVKEKLKNIYLKHNPEIYDFISENIDLGKVDILNAEIIDSANPYHVEILPEKSLELFVNLHRFNTFSKMNEYLHSVHKKLKRNGLFISKFEPCEKRRLYFMINYPPSLANILFLLDFWWSRVFSKLPFFNRLYFTVTRGRNRVYSMAEGLGRLYFSGFSLVAIEEVDNYIYFIARKVKEPVSDRRPSYGMIFAQKRVGYKKKLISVYKMRTMHPYSEFIHQYAIDKNRLNDKGKIDDDFRITFWGKFFRKFWIDELPMLINLLKRDIKLFGVRPLSETFYDIYPEDLKELRIRYKPGLIPPFYADMPTSIEEVWESERLYLKKYGKAPLRTDVSYFLRAVKNIVIKRAKSG